MVHFDFENPPSVPDVIREYVNRVNRNIDAAGTGVQTAVRNILGRDRLDPTADDLRRLATEVRRNETHRQLRSLLYTDPHFTHGGETYNATESMSRIAEGPERPQPAPGAPPAAPPTGPAPPTAPAPSRGVWTKVKEAAKAVGNAALKTGEYVAGSTAAALPFFFETSRNFILNIPLLGDALKGAATLAEPLAKGIGLPALQSKIIAGAGFLKGVPVLGTVAPAIAPYVLPTALTGAGLWTLGKLSDKLHNWLRKEGEPEIQKAGIFKTMWRGLTTPVTLPYLAITKAPTLVKKGFNAVKYVSAPLFRHKIGTYGGAFLGYAVLAPMTGGMAIPWAIAGALGGRFIQKRWFSGRAAAPKPEALPTH